MSKSYTIAEVAKHNTPQDCWCVIGNKNNGGAKVYDLTKYFEDHPGGKEIILKFAGKNADRAFIGAKHSNFATNRLPEFEIGVLDEAQGSGEGSQCCVIC